jgi:peptidoglycan/xylan/chitin deacetylase (PgdA/CDA1 family)
VKRPYHPSWFIILSGLLHTFGVLVFCWNPVLGPHVLAILLLNHLVITALGLWPRSSLLGPNTVRIAGSSSLIYLTFDDGPNPHVTPKVLDLLDRYDCRCTFFVIGEHVRKHPELLREIVRRGHAVGNHSDAHAYTFAMQGVDGFSRELKVAQKAIFEAIGLWPHYFRAPFGFRSPLLEPALCRTGLHLVSWTRRGFDTRCNSPSKVLDRLTHNLASGDILLLHDGPYGSPPEGETMVLKVLPSLLEILKKRHLRSVPLPDPYEV